MLYRPNNPVATRLIEARAEIEDSDRWWDGKGDSRTRLCALAAIGDFAASNVFVRANGLVGSSSKSVPAFNDSHTHAEVLAAFDRAIAFALTESQ